ncbi:hypothetical protein EJ05DRAFT_478950 [Pseudovirgaria hyperparasitica]|uniref:Uncharacterized protein n=1 Tax=Pseudovirgaria hyperparasitica TaxID=470096 RepID=A0A6A6VY18_9PEZI|nr:uncharacterized protein EJ05DRAFT_478950 [Pseudovirgaria hyperparasitica]KAF2755143.1 hypothetical protein EJ05DRAFT_478950 [Pseudovirgaria hyperparasitica]
MPFTRRSRVEPGSKPPTPNTKAITNGSSPATISRKLLRSASNLSPTLSTTTRKSSRPRRARAIADGTKVTFRGLPEDFLSNLLIDSQLKNVANVPELESLSKVDVITSPVKSSPVSTKSKEQTLPNEIEDQTSEESMVDSESENSPAPKFTPKGSRAGRVRGRGRGGRPRGRGRGGRQPPIEPPHLEPPARRRAFRDAAPKNLAETSDEGESMPVTPAEEPQGREINVSTDRPEAGVDANDKSTVSATMRTNIESHDRAEADEPAQSIEKPIPRHPRTLTRENSGASLSHQVATPSEVVEPIEETLMDIDLPAPFIEDYEIPDRKDCDDIADFIMKSRYKPMTDPQAFISALTKYEPSKRSTSVLYELAENVQQTLKAWQDEYLALDALTAPAANPPKKVATGGRIPYDKATWEDMREADLYNYAYDSRKPPGTQDPMAQRIGRDGTGGRELRQRRARDALGSTQVSEEDEENENGVGKRKRRAAQRFEGTATPEFGARGTRKRLLAQEADGNMEDGGGKRIRTTAALLPQRIREMRGESIANSSTEGEDGSPEPPGGKRRGRPPGSRNLQRRPDAGIKKGPRKVNETSETETGEPMSGVRFVTAARPPVSPAVEAATIPQPDFNIVTGKVQISPQTFDADGNPTRRKQRAKSEKRSASMTAWWAERKARAAQQKADEMEHMQRNFSRLPQSTIQHDPRQHPVQMNQPLPPPPHAHYPGTSVHHAPALAPAGPHPAAAYPLTGGPPQFIPHNPAHHPQHPYPQGHHQQQPPPPRSAHGPPSGHHDAYFVRAGPVTGQYTLNPNKISGPPQGVPSPYGPIPPPQGHFRPASRGH